ncbi:cytochrome b5 reductase 4-like isoform X2 [Gordionus sp. m RMFG-2023]|uniref:cytochrome b5 reductase 4-like isoform X2 n=1 Tax=Gordionus sp. m RMFG-2023 TaxID=3053472 RepID=UPI0031FD57E1
MKPINSLSVNALNKRKPVALKPGHSLLNWISYCASKPDLSSFYPKSKPPFITSEELCKHNTENDCWMSIQNNVFNMTPYLEYHPGGIEELMKGAGKDATTLFMEIHKWVNYPKLLAKCYIAPLKKIPFNTLSIPEIVIPAIQNLPVNNNAIKSASFSILTEIADVSNHFKDSNISKLISFSSYEKDRRKYSLHNQVDTLALVIKSAKYSIKIQKGFVARLKSNSIQFLAYFTDLRYMLHLEFLPPTKNYCKIKWDNIDIGSVEIDIYYLMGKEKTIANYSNPNLLVTNSNSNNSSHRYRPLINNDFIYPALDYTMHMQYHKCTLVEKERLTFDTYSFIFALPPDISMKTPLGFHTFIKLDQNKPNLVKPYTPVPTSLILSRDSVFSPLADIIPFYNNSLNFIIKIYADGVFTQTLDQKIKIGDPVWISDFVGDFNESLLLKNLQKLLLIGAGTGITPILGILNRIYNDNNAAPVDPNISKDISTKNISKSNFDKILLMDFNKTTEDIIYHNQFNHLRDTWSNRFTYISVISRPNVKIKSHKGPVGRINANMLKKYALPILLPNVDADIETKIFDIHRSCTINNVLVCICGSTAFNQSAHDI